MQVSVESTGKLERRMLVQVPAERVTSEIASRLKTLSRTARLNGFRPGKAPIAVIRRQFGVQVHREVIGELLQSSFAEAVSQQKLAPAGSPHIEPQSMDEGQDLKYVATFEVFPEIVLQPIEKLEVERTTAEVTDADVDAMIERLRKQQPKYSAVTRAAQTGDRATVDFEGSIGGVAFAGGKGENVAIVLGEGRMLPQIEQGLVGAAAGEHRDIVVQFPADYRATELAGKQADFKVQVKTVEEAALPELDEEFCKSYGVTEGGVPKLREDVANNMRRELQQTLRNHNKTVVMDRLYQANPLEVPNALVETQVRDMQIEALRRVALGLIFNDIIRRQGLALDPARTEARLDEMAGAYGDAAALKRAYRQNADALRQVESIALEDQVVDWILAHAKVRDVGLNFKEVMKFEG